MEELGVGGFMGVQDVRPGMKIAVVLNGSQEANIEWIGEVVNCVDKEVYVDLDDGKRDIVSRREKQTFCQLRIVVDNVLYKWEDIAISLSQSNENGKYKLVVESNPQVFNRRKYPRVPLLNPCRIKVKGEEKVYAGRMVNISANGFAFASREEIFAEIKGEDVEVAIKDFAVLDGKALEGCIIRTSNNDGEYIVGCRMPQDSDLIKKYVSQNYSE